MRTLMRKKLKVFLAKRKEQEAIMHETTSYMTQSAQSYAFPAHKTNEAEPQRIQVSCIDDDDLLFLSPRPFCFSRREQSDRRRLFRTKSTNPIRNIDDFIDRSVRYVRRIGYALILGSVLLLVIDGILRNTFSL